jgi:hypothetical protein
MDVKQSLTVKEGHKLQVHETKVLRKNNIFGLKNKICEQFRILHSTRKRISFNFGKYITVFQAELYAIKSCAGAIRVGTYLYSIRHFSCG